MLNRTFSAAIFIAQLKHFNYYSILCCIGLLTCPKHIKQAKLQAWQRAHRRWWRQSYNWWACAIEIRAWFKSVSGLQCVLWLKIIDNILECRLLSCFRNLPSSQATLSGKVLLCFPQMITLMRTLVRWTLQKNSLSEHFILQSLYVSYSWPHWSHWQF